MSLINQETGSVFTRDQLKEVFDMVADSNDWKNPINASVDYPENVDHYIFRYMVREAVIFYTSSVPGIHIKRRLPGVKVGQTIHVTARGYYQAAKDGYG